MSHKIAHPPFPNAVRETDALLRNRQSSAPVAWLRRAVEGAEDARKSFERVHLSPQSSTLCDKDFAKLNRAGRQIPIEISLSSLKDALKHQANYFSRQVECVTKNR
jgi:hypothetical protein